MDLNILASISPGKGRPSPSFGLDPTSSFEEMEIKNYIFFKLKSRKKQSENIRPITTYVQLISSN